MAADIRRKCGSRSCDGQGRIEKEEGFSVYLHTRESRDSAFAISQRKIKGGPGRTGATAAGSGLLHHITVKTTFKAQL